MNLKVLPKEQDPEIIKELEAALEDAKTGNLRNFAAVYTNKEGVTYSVLMNTNAEFAAYASVLLARRVK